MVREIRCPVCWGNVDDRAVACGRCESPHHDDCFVFAGGCGVFGCGGSVTRPWQAAGPGEVIAVEPAPESPRAATGLPRTLGRRILDSGTCLARNWRLALTLGVLHAGILAFAGFLVGLTPLDSDLASYVSSRAPHIKRLVEVHTRTSGEVKLDRGLPAAAPGETAVAPLKPLPIEVGAATVFLLDTTNVLGLFFMVTMIAGLLGRSRGKQLSESDLLDIARGRFARVLSTVVAVAMRMLAPGLASLTLVLMLGVVVGPLAWILAPVLALLAVGWAVYAGNLYSLAVTIAAVGPEEEPGDPLARSADLVRLAPFEILVGYWAVGILQAIVFGLAGGFLTVGYGVFTAVAGSGGFVTGVVELGMMSLLVSLLLTMPCYNVLLYLECRKARDARDLPYFPSEMTGARG